MAYETEKQERNRVARDEAHFAKQNMVRAEQRKHDMATKYSDETIRAWIDLAANKNVPPEASRAKSQVAQAMIAYNNMIDKRWKNA